MTESGRKRSRGKKSVSDQEHSDPPSNSDSAAQGGFLGGVENEGFNYSEMEAIESLELLRSGILFGGHKDENVNKEEKPVRRRGRRREKRESMEEIWNDHTEQWINNVQNEEEEDAGMNQVMEPSSQITTKLFLHQMEWLAWAVNQEESNPNVKGGILADEMGMGKTLEAISLVLTKRSMNQRGTAPLGCKSSQVNATLVVCPVAGLKQWESEINRHTMVGCTKVLVYRGTQEDKSLIMLSEYDFVLTTYSTVDASWFSYQQSSNSEKRKVEPYGKDNVAGRKAKKPGKELKRGAPELSNIHDLKWNRIILDEAHHIKKRDSHTAKAVCALDSSYRWALTGIPIQKNIEELYSMICFLRVFPCAYYMCRFCRCESLTQDCSRSGCHHTKRDHFCWWKKFVRKPIGIYQHEDGRRRALALLKNGILRSILLRRMKDSRAGKFILPPKQVRLRQDSLDKDEQDYYEGLHTEVKEYLDRHRNYMSNYAYVFQHLTKLRQAVSHRYLITFADKEDCRICREPAQDPQVASCKHIFCKECLKSSLSNGCPSCPSERRTALKDFRRWNIVDKFQLEGFQTSTKIEALREEISFMFKYDGSAKGLVFSHFIGFLDLIGYSLEKSGIHCTKLAGSMTQKQKDDAVKKFNDESECRIFLLGMRAGGVPLDLTVASHVFLMEPGWNPAPELQAQDRVHRIGQYKPVKVVRFIIESTIEERILKLQEKKKAGIDHIIGSSSEDEGLTSQDLIYLFDYHERDPPGDYHE